MARGSDLESAWESAVAPALGVNPVFHLTEPVIMAERGHPHLTIGCARATDAKKAQHPHLTVGCARATDAKMSPVLARQMKVAEIRDFRNRNVFGLKPLGSDSKVETFSV